MWQLQIKQFNQRPMQKNVIKVIFAILVKHLYSFKNFKIMILDFSSYKFVQKFSIFKELKLKLNPEQKKKIDF